MEVLGAIAAVLGAIVGLANLSGGGSPSQAAQDTGSQNAAGAAE